MILIFGYLGRAGRAVLFTVLSINYNKVKDLVFIADLDTMMSSWYFYTRGLTFLITISV